MGFTESCKGIFAEYVRTSGEPSLPRRQMPYRMPFHGTFYWVKKERTERC